MLTIYISKGVTPGVNLREYMPPPSVNKATYSGFEIQRIKGYQKSKTGVSLAQNLKKVTDIEDKGSFSLPKHIGAC